MHRSVSWTFVLLGWLGASLMIGSCDSPVRADDPDLWVLTDRTSYELDFVPGLYHLSLTARYTNRSSQTVWLHRGCGYADHPSRRLVRADESDTEIWLHSGVCITRPLRDPIPVGAGEMFVDQVELVSSVSPHAQPPITMEMRTGTFRLVYAVQSSNEVEGWEPVDLVPLEERMSNAFVVRGP